jgi:hypothetical protein
MDFPELNSDNLLLKVSSSNFGTKSMPPFLIWPHTQRCLFLKEPKEKSEKPERLPSPDGTWL